MMWSKISNALKPRETTNPLPDLFCTNSTTYYTNQTPSQGLQSRTTSREEHIIWSLRTQLALQQEICAQFEIDLGARDELVSALTTRLEALEKENDKHTNAVRSWKRKAADLEELCRHLQEEGDLCRQESVERSIMDTASGDALCLCNRDNLSAEITQLRAHIQQLQKDSAAKEVTIVQLNKQRDQDKEDIDGLNIALESKQQELELVKRKHGATRASGRTSMVPSAVVKPAVQPLKALRTSAVSNRASSPVQYRLRYP